MLTDKEIALSPIFDVLSVREVMADLGVKQQKTVTLACMTGRVIARKCDAEPGSRGGQWLIDRASATKLWGYIKQKEINHEQR